MVESKLVLLRYCEMSENDEELFKDILDVQEKYLMLGNQGTTNVFRMTFLVTVSVMATILAPTVALPSGQNSPSKVSKALMWM